MDNFLSSGQQDVKNIFNRFRKRDFSGHTGQAIKNSTYQLITNLVMKIGSLLFTIILARMLLPEKMGLYTLALSTIVFFSAFSDFGVGTAVLTFVSKFLGKNNPEKAKGYVEKLLRWKTTMLIICSSLLILSSYFVSKYYYDKPLFYALLVGGLYIMILGFLGFVENLFRAKNDFKTPLIKEALFQTLRLIFVPLGILLFLELNLSSEILVAGIILLLVFCYFFSLIYLWMKTKRKLLFLKLESKKLSKTQNKELKKFILPLTFTALSGIFFGYVDMLMLGRFVSESYIAFYGAALSLISSGTAIIGFISTAMFPLFSKLEGDSLKKLFRKSLNLTILISLLAGIFTYLFAYSLIKITYGSQYLASVPILRLFSVLVILLPFSAILDAYLISRKRTKPLAWLLVISTILNIILNYVGITYGLRFSEYHAVLGACFATIISRAFYLIGAVIVKGNKSSKK